MIITASQLNQKDGTNIEVDTILIMFVLRQGFLTGKMLLLQILCLSNPSKCQSLNNCYIKGKAQVGDSHDHPLTRVTQQNLARTS